MLHQDIKANNILIIRKRSTPSTPPNQLLSGAGALLLLTTSGYFESSPSSHPLTIAESELASIEQEVIDFGDCAAIPADQSMLDYYAADLSRVDVLMLGCVIYSIDTCKVWTWDCLEVGLWTNGPKTSRVGATRAAIRIARNDETMMSTLQFDPTFRACRRKYSGRTGRL